MTEPQEQHQDLKVSVEDFESALRLLEDEERATHTGGRPVSPAGVAVSFIAYVFVLTSLCLGASGLSVIWFDWETGRRMLMLAGFALGSIFVVMLIQTFFMRSKSVLEMIISTRKEIGESDVGRLSDAVSHKRKHMPVWGALPFLLGIFGVLLFALALWRSSPALTILSLAMQGVAAVAFAAVTVKSNYEEVKYLKRVSRLREKFQARPQSGDGCVAVSGGEAEVLAHVERRRATREAVNAIQEFGAETASLYGVVFMPEARDALIHESAERVGRIREAVDSLQSDPRPPAAVPAGDDGTFVIEGDDYFIRYKVEDARERLFVTAIGAKEVSHVS